jgi:hypothetical protein
MASQATVLYSTFVSQLVLVVDLSEQHKIHCGAFVR